ETLAAEFNDRIEQYKKDSSLEEWDKISAALGYAFYDTSTDRYADDVFKRADQVMYERKKEMKKK
ncbi:MAG: diguanylate cyclase, partial [Firmicutes bacterium]|nr:diguanylate cyclase [Bacillota bacterium]